VTWDDPAVAAWWRDEVAADEAHAAEVVPLLLDVLAPEPGASYLDLGCGDGRVMAAVAGAGGSPIGTDIAGPLLELAHDHGPVVRSRLPHLGWVAPDSLDGAYATLVFEHVAELRQLFSDLASAVRPGGVLALVVNHPVQTAPGSGPFVDPDDFEVLWRWGRYLQVGYSDEPAGAHRVTFHHRSLAILLTTAAGAGWSLERLEERGIGDERAAADDLLAAQQSIPWLLGVRWRLITDSPADDRSVEGAPLI